jgi:hypothetical protein
VIDAFMMFTVFTGFAFCAAYFRAEYIDWRQYRISDVEKMIRVRLLYEIGGPRAPTVVGVGAQIDLTDAGLADRTASGLHRWME